MAKNRKNIGRVRRYNHNFYTTGRHYWAKRILVIVLVAALIFGLGIFVAPAVLDWGTHFWYTVVKNQDLPEPTPTATPVPENVNTDSEQGTEPTAEPTPAVPEEIPVNADVLQGKLQVLRLSALQTAEDLEKTAQALQDQGITYGVVPLKDESGYIYYPSQVPYAAESIAATTIDPAVVAASLKAHGVQPVAEIAAFKDPMVNRELCIRYTGMDYAWLDNKADAGGKRWTNPYAPQAIQYIGDLIQEAHDMGFETVVLTGVQFPRHQSGKQDFGDTHGVDRAGQLQAVVAAWEQRFAGSVKLIYEVPFDSCVSASPTLGGVSPSQLGMKNLMIRMPEQDAEAEPDAEAVTQETVVAGLYAEGVASVAVRNGVNGEILPKP